MRKSKNILLVFALVEERDGVEYFKYDRAKLLTGGTTVSIMRFQLEKENILIDLRLHDKGTRARNHGTGFRVSERDLPNLYSTIKEIEF